jgi:hypothetical protein
MDQQIQREAPPDTKRMVRQLEETTGIAVDMMGKLHEQGDQMNRIIGLNEETGAVLYDAERLTKQLSVRGRISNLFKSKRKSRSNMPAQTSAEQHKDDKKEKKGKKEKALSTETDPSDTVWVDRSKEDPLHGHPPELSSSQMAMVQEQDADLDQMSNMLSALKEMSIATQSELNSQSQKIDHIDHQVDKNLYSLQKTTKKLAR